MGRGSWEGCSILQDSDNSTWRAHRQHHPISSTRSLSVSISLHHVVFFFFPCSFTLCPLLPIYLAQFLWEQWARGARGALKSRRKKEAKPGVQWEHGGPGGWAERWGTDTGVCDKRMSFTANDSHRGDQLLSLQNLTHALRQWSIDLAPHMKNTNLTRLGLKVTQEAEAVAIFLSFMLPHYL